MNKSNQVSTVAQISNLPVDAFLEETRITGSNPPISLLLDDLPPLLKAGAKELRNEREQLLFIKSTLAVLSGVMTGIKGVYGQRECYSNLFFIALAHAASGKGAMMYAKELVMGIHNKILKESRETLNLYNRTKARKGSSNHVQPRPPFKVAIVPGNCSSSKLMQHLIDNFPYTPQIIIESEIDTISTANASEWGNYTDILRKAFHNEAVTLSRKGNDSEFLEVATPKLAVILSGTMGQIFKLINNNEDGLFSRFLVMKFEGDSKWNDVGPCLGCKNLTAFFKGQSEEYIKLWEFVSQQEIVVELTTIQWQTINSYCDAKNVEIQEDHGPAASSLIKRHGLMLFKLCMVLTGMRAYEEKITSGTMICRQSDFDTAFYLVDQSIDSALEIFHLLPSVRSPKLDDTKDRLFQLLPQKFQRKNAIQLGAIEKVSERSTDRWLQQLIQDNKLSQPAMGEYIKV